MTRDIISLTIPDLSAYAKLLRADLLARPTPPSHLTLLSSLARAAGFSNYQHLRAQNQPVTGPVDLRRVTKARRVFDSTGRMQHWPSQTVIQGLCLWVLWARLPARRDLTEAAVNEVLKNGALFGDHVLLRRSLIDHGLVTRTQDGGVYRRIEKSPDAEALALIRSVADLSRPTPA